MDFGRDSMVRIIESLNDGLYFVDRNRKITYWNKAAERISGFSAEEVIGHHCHDNILTHIDAEGKQLCFMGCPLEQTIADQKPREARIFMHHKDGHRIPVSVRVSALTDRKGQVIGGIELFTDISNQSAIELRMKELEKMALLDSLTQLANRNYIEREIYSRFEEKKRFQISFGILFIDIDHFKKFNDTYGHDVGDKVLKFVADTFVHNARPFDLFGRWGGEEFIGIIRNTSRQELAKIGDRIRLLVEQSYLNHEGLKLNVTISIGATLVQDGDTMKSILKRSDELLYQSKKAGRNCLTID